MTTANVTRLDDNRIKLEVEVSPEAVKKGVEAKVRELRKQVRVPGFRPGKAPRRIIENHVGRDYIYVEALQDSLPTWYSEAVVEQDLRPIDTPKIDFDGTLDEERGFSFSAEVEVRPEAKLGRYKGLEVPKREVSVDDEQVDERLEELREQFATLAAVEDRPVAEGDYVVLDYKGEGLSGTPVQGAEAEDYMLEVGGGELLEDFEKELVGIEANGRKRFAVTFPMEYSEESLRGQSVLFNVHVKEIKERDLPPLDDDLAMEASEFDTLEELRAAVREQLEGALIQRAEGEFRGRVLDAVAKEAEVAVPDVMVDDKADEMVQSFERSVQSQGIEPEQYYQLAGSSRDDVKGRVRDDAADTVKKELVLDAVAQAEGIVADGHELEHQIEHLAEDSGRKPKEVEKTMRRNGTYRLLEEELSRQKALDFLAENAVAVPMPPEEEEAGDEGAAATEAESVEETPGAEEAEPEAGEARVGATVEAGGATAGEEPEAEKTEGEERS